VLGAGTGYTARQNFALVIHKAFQHIGIFVINIFDAGFGKFALSFFAMSFLRV
jgi:hypothetical protein